jgi:putative endonuclease
MFTVYILYSSKYDRIYIGCTSDIVSRLKSHNELGTKGWTIRFRPWQLIYIEIFETKQEALLREKQLKGARQRAWIWDELVPKNQ